MRPRRLIATHKVIAPAIAVLALSLVTGAAITTAAPEPRADAATLKVDRIVVWKSARRMSLVYRGRVVRTYSIALGFAPKGHKTTEGDGKTPEGVYRIDARNPKSKFHLSLRISYPNAADRAQARQRGVSPGGQIFIHGQPNRLRVAAKHVSMPGDWALGCIAVSNRAIGEIWRSVAVGTPIELRA